MSKETLCWRCQNFSKCSWSRGKPVKGWDATPVVIKETINGERKNINSYCVESCPQFVCDVAGIRTSSEAIAEILGISKRTLMYWLRSYRVKAISEMRLKGYELTIYKPHIRKYYYLRKI